MIREQFRLLMDQELIVDLFAGGGGMSTATEHALGRAPDIAINHNEQALSMHQANHPQTAHYIADVFEVCPHEATNGVAVGYLHMSPDCTHHSQAAGGQPRSKKIRGLAWVGTRWAGQVAPRVISLENVKQILKWGPLIAKRDKATGRVIKLDGTVATKGERVPVDNQHLIPDRKHEGQTWRKFVRTLELMGYVVDWQIINAADFGAPTTRERLYMIARRDGKQIQWPAPTHFKHPAKGQKKWRAAAECINWNLPCPSIFERNKPLADKTLHRVAKGMQKFVIDAAEPFIVPIANWSNETLHASSEPLRTITAWPKGGSFALAAPLLVKFRHDSIGQRLDLPLPTITAGGNAKRPAGAAHAMGIATAYMMQANGGFNTTPGHDLRKPTSTITNTGSQQQLVTANLVTLRKNCTSEDIAKPLGTITANGTHHALVEYTLAPEDTERALRCAAFLISYYGTDNMRSLDEPAATITTRDRLALVTVWIQNEPWVIVDIGLRMLSPAELYACQGFPLNYIIDRGHDGRIFTKSDQVKMCGNSVPPPPATAFIRANLPELAAWSAKERKEMERIAA